MWENRIFMKKQFLVGFLVFSFMIPGVELVYAAPGEGVNSVETSEVIDSGGIYVARESAGKKRFSFKKFRERFGFGRKKTQIVKKRSLSRFKFRKPKGKKVIQKRSMMLI
jgi:hypothetical protein